MSTYLSNVPTPKEGWVEELTKAEAAAKKDRSATAKLRVATAACKMRQWKKCKTVSNLALAFDPSDAEKKILSAYVKMSSKELETKIQLDAATLKDLRHSSVDCDTFIVSGEDEESNQFTILQFAVESGDVPLLEEVVAAGAALDIPGPPQGQKETRGATALLLACTSIAMGDILRRTRSAQQAPRQLLDRLDRICECATRLVYLGADCQLKLKLSKIKKKSSAKTPLFHQYKFGGKTALELAKLSDRRDLVEAMESMQDRKDAIRLTQCRCGSRLPWKECHGAPIPGQSPLYTTDDDRLIWRYSPKALCNCRLTKKEYYKCCWFSPAPEYQLDTTGQVQVRQILESGGCAAAALDHAARTAGQGMDAGDITNMFDVGSLGTQEDFRAAQAAIFRQFGLGMLPDRNGRRCTVKDWDQEVFAGVMERIDNFFTWDDLHWHLSRPELLLRTSQWNVALEQHCNDMGLCGLERESVTRKHTANPCAPCANPLCDSFETRPKEFFACARCKRVAYCSTDCQIQDWTKKKHIGRCQQT